MAIAEYDTVISIDRYFAHTSIYTMRGDLYCLRGWYDLAIADYTTAISIAPKLVGLGPLEDQRDPEKVENVLKDAYCGRGSSPIRRCEGRATAWPSPILLTQRLSS